MDHDRRAPTMTFVGGAGTVTGSKTLVETSDGARMLVDCGLFQGRKELRLRNWAPFDVPPESIDAVLLTHAHIDHCGYLPRLVRLGFRGPVYCTEGTRRLAAIVLPDSGHLHEEEARYAQRKGYSKHDPPLPLYTEQEARTCLEQFVSVPYDRPTAIAHGVEASWRRAGHILGAASIAVRVADRTILFSGDLGRSTHPLLLPPDDIESADVVISESTYGDEDHPEHDAERSIAEVVNGAARRGGVVLVPAFAVDRTETVLWYLDRLVRSGAVPPIPVFVDSPMACRALDVYRSEALAGSPEFRPELRGTRLFASVELTEARSTEQSIELNSRPGPMVIVSASGMITGGRVLHHVAHRIGDHRNVVLLVGFQAPGTRGDRLRRGARELKLLGRMWPVRADIVSIALSAHADRSDLVDWERTAPRAPGIVYVNHGEPDSAAGLVEALRQQLGLRAIAPRPGDRVRLDA